MSDDCPNCGFRLRGDLLAEVDGFLIDPRGAAAYAGKAVKLRPAGAAILYALANASGRFLSRDALCSRMNSQGFPKVVDVQVCFLRRSLRRAGVPVPVEAGRGRGYRWAAPRPVMTGA